MQTAESWTRDAATPNNFLGNGGTELNTTSKMYDLDFRNYDPALARMHQVDLMADKYGSQTPYHFALNNPVMMNDPTGLSPYNPYLFMNDEYEATSSGLRNDQVAVRGGSEGASIKDDGNKGLYRDTNNNGIQDEGESSFYTDGVATGNANSQWFKITTNYQITWGLKDGKGNYDPAQSSTFSWSEVGYVQASQADPGQLHVELTSVDFRGGLPPDYIGVQMKAWYEQSASDAKRFSGYNWIYETTANGHSQIQTDPNDFTHSGPLYYGYDDGKYGNGGDGNSELADLNFYEASKNLRSSLAQQRPL